MKDNLMRNPVRVLHLRDSPWLDGPARTILESAEAFDAGRIDYRVGALVPSATAPHDFVAALDQRGIVCHRILDQGAFDSGVLTQLLDLVDAHSIEVLHCSDFRTSLFGLMCGWRRPLKLVSTAHGWIANSQRRKLMRLLHKAALRGFDEVIAVSAATAAQLPPWWVPRRRVHVLHNALVVGRYGNQQADLPRRSLPADGSIRILNVGRLSPEKGQSLLLQALVLVRERHPGVQLLIAGVGPQEVPLRELARSLGVESAVTFLGYVADMPPVYQEVDLVIQSSFTEGLPNVILEAAYLRVPIIATDVGGTSEIIEDGKSGVLIRPGSVDGLAAAILRFLADPARHLAMTQAARARIEAAFTMTARAERMMRLYEVLARPQERPET